MGILSLVGDGVAARQVEGAEGGVGKERSSELEQVLVVHLPAVRQIEIGDL